MLKHLIAQNDINFTIAQRNILCRSDFSLD